MARIRLTAAQAAVRYLASQFIDAARRRGRLTSPGAWAIFGHGNVAGLGEALHAAGEALPTFRAHNEQAMAHAAIAFAKASRRRRAMVCTSSIGPGALNMVTAAAVAHVNRLPVLLPAGRRVRRRGARPGAAAGGGFRRRHGERQRLLPARSRATSTASQRPEQLLDALPRAMSTLLDPAACGPVTLAFCQDAQAEAWDFPAQDSSSPRPGASARPPPAAEELRRAAGVCARRARR